MKEQIEEKHALSESIYMSGHGLDWKDSDDIAEQLYTEGYRKQEWISVEDRLPERLKHAIVCDENGIVGEAYHFGKGRFEWMGDEGRAFVTHWMPLPEPPKMKGGAE